jgi:hypothetical protein
MTVGCAVLVFSGDLGGVEGGEVVRFKPRKLDLDGLPRSIAPRMMSEACERSAHHLKEID